MDIYRIDGVRELAIEEQRELDGGVLPGGCIDPTMQKILDLLNGVGTP